jgi:hypothetical protein
VSGHTGSFFNTNSSPQWTLDSNATRYITLSNPYPQDLTYPLGNAQGDKTYLGLGAGTILRNTANNPQMYQWNFSIRREVGWQSMVEVNYTGSRGVKLTNAAVPNSFYGYISDPKANNLNKQTVQLYRLLRPMPQFDGAGSSELGTGDSWYNAMQMKWEKRFSRSLTLLAHYTWSKFLDDVSNGSGNLDWLSATNGRNLQDLFDYRQEKSFSSNDVAHRFVATGVYQLPVVQGRPYANNINRILDGFIGGTLRSGTQRPNLIGSPATSGSVYDRFNNWFSVAAFSQPPIDTFGSAPRFVNVRGPRLNTLDAAVTKAWKTTESQRLEFRLEASNAREPIKRPAGFFLSTAVSAPPATAPRSGPAGCRRAARKKPVAGCPCPVAGNGRRSAVSAPCNRAAWRPRAG